MNEKPVKVLTIFDDPGLRKSFTTGLKNIEVVHRDARSIAEAIEELQGGNFRGLIMNGINGRWRQLLSEAARAETSPVLIASSRIIAMEAASFLPVFHTSEVTSGRDRTLRPVYQAAQII